MTWQHAPLAAIVLAILALHFATIARPNDLVFDEVHYVAEARGIIAGWGPYYMEHPPLAKLFIVTGIRLFGDNPIGWRLFPILFGGVSIVLFCFICSSLRMSRRAQLIATLLFSFENLSFVQSGLAMLDVYMVTFMLAAFLLYLRARHLASGLAVGLSALAKLPGLAAFPVIFLHWLFGTKRRVLSILLVTVAAAASFLLLYSLADFALSHTFHSPLKLIEVMLQKGGSIRAGGVPTDMPSRPWEWFLAPISLLYSPVPQYLAILTPTLWLLAIPSVLYMAFKAWRRSSAGLFGLAWFAATYLPWIPIALLTDRTTYVYYLYPVVGALAIGLGLGIDDLLRSNVLPRRLAITGVGAFLVLHVALFVVLSPLFPAMVTWPGVGA